MTGLVIEMPEDWRCICVSRAPDHSQATMCNFRQNLHFVIVSKRTKSLSSVSVVGKAPGLLGLDL